MYASYLGSNEPNGFMKIAYDSLPPNPTYSLNISRYLSPPLIKSVIRGEPLHTLPQNTGYSDLIATGVYLSYSVQSSVRKKHKFSKANKPTCKVAQIFLTQNHGSQYRSERQAQQLAISLNHRRQSLPVSGRQERQLGQPVCRSRESRENKVGEKPPLGTRRLS
jgi:hypothetical protein